MIGYVDVRVRFVSPDGITGVFNGRSKTGHNISMLRYHAIWNAAYQFFYDLGIAFDSSNDFSDYIDSYKIISQQYITKSTHKRVSHKKKMKKSTTVRMEYIRGYTRKGKRIKGYYRRKKR